MNRWVDEWRDRRKDRGKGEEIGGGGGVKKE